MRGAIHDDAVAAAGDGHATRVATPGRKTRVFLSFDFESDRGLRDLVLGQAKHPKAKFEIVNRSLMEAAPEPTWQSEARAAIKNSDIAVVLLGKHTHRAPGVLKEVQMARECGVPLAQMIGYRNGRFKRVPDAGRLYAWTAENLRRCSSRSQAHPQRR